MSKVVGITGEDLLVAPEGNQTEEFDSHAVLMKKILKEVEEIQNYNKNLFKNLHDEVKTMKFHGPFVAVRLFKHIPYTESGIANPMLIPTKSEGGKTETIQHPFQYQHRGILVKISPDCDSTFTNIYKEGDIIDFSPHVNTFDHVMYLDADRYGIDGPILAFDNYFKVNYNMIEKGWGSEVYKWKDHPFVKRNKESGNKS